MGLPNFLIASYLLEAGAFPSGKRSNPTNSARDGKNLVLQNLIDTLCSTNTSKMATKYATNISEVFKNANRSSIMIDESGFSRLRNISEDKVRLSSLIATGANLLY